MGQISTFGSLTQLNFNFAQVTSLNKTFGNFSFDGYYYEKMNIIGVARLVATPAFTSAITLFETINVTDGKYEQIGPREIGFLFSNKPIIFSTQLILSTAMNMKLLKENTFDYEIMKSLGFIGKIKRDIPINAQISNSLGIKSQIISNKNNI